MIEIRPVWKSDVGYGKTLPSDTMDTPWERHNKLVSLKVYGLELCEKGIPFVVKETDESTGAVRYQGGKAWCK